MDDEAIITDGLMCLFKDQEELKLDAYASYLAPEALDFMKNTKIDIVLTAFNRGFGLELFLKGFHIKSVGSCLWSPCFSLFQRI